MFNFRKNHVLQAVLFVIIIWLVILLKAVLVAFFIAFLLVTALRPVVAYLRRRHFPTPLAVLVPVVLVLVVLVLIGYYFVPQLASEANHFSTQAPGYITAIQNNGLNLPINTSSLKNALQGHFGAISGVVITATKTAAEVLIGIVSIIVVSLYWLGSYDYVQQSMLSFVPAKSRQRAGDIWARVEKKIVSWVFAQVLLGVAVGVLVWIGALIIGLPYAGALGVIAGLLEIIPTLGPIAAAIPGILLGLTISVQTAIAALIVYVIVQQLENHLLAPLLLGRTVKLSPIIIIFSLLVGATLYGILGAFLAVPIALVISAFVESYRAGKPKLKPSSEITGHPATQKS